jgi:hypothetical protein
MKRFDLLEPPPLTTKRYVWRSLVAAGALLGLWAIVLLTNWTMGGGIILLGFPILMIVGLCAPIDLHGWKSRLIAFLCWVSTWPVVYLFGVSLAFSIGEGS